MDEDNNVRVKIGKWEFDAFITENGSLGLTIDKPGPFSEIKEESHCLDIFVDEDLVLGGEAMNRFT